MKKLTLISTVLAAVISVFAVLKTRLPAGATSDSKTSFDTSRKDPHSGWATTDRDGVVSVTYFNLFREGPTTVTRIQPNSVAQLPRGFYLHSDLAFEISTDAIVSGPHTILFRIPSVNDPELFASLTILHRERDQMDPAQMRWVNRTILQPDKPGPDFANRNISAKAEDTGQFVIARVDRSEIANAPVADLEVSVKSSSETLRPGQSLAFTIVVKNNGPQPASGVIVNHVFGPWEMRLINSNSSEGNCRKSERSDDTTICILDRLDAGASATVIIEARLTANQYFLPKDKQRFLNITTVLGQEHDSNFANNQAQTYTTVLRPR
jgi:hypothetical protein